MKNPTPLSQPQNKHPSCIFSLFGENQTITKNPTIGVIAPKTPKKLPQYVDKNDMERLFSDELFPDTFEGQRDKMIIEMFYDTGIRLSELINIKVQDINFQDNTIRIFGKRSKERIIPFGNRLDELLTIYLDNYEKIFLLNQKIIISL